jgi:hypothetical protein
MEDNEKLIESLLEKAVDYGKTSFELAKLITLEKTADVASSVGPHSVALLFIASFMFFLNLGLAFLLGEILGETYYGFFAIAAFYGIIGLVLHLFMHKWLKKKISNYIIKQVLK